MSVPVASQRFELSVRTLLPPAALVIALVLRWRLGLGVVWVTLLILPVLAFSFGLGSLLRARAKRFEREMLRLIQLRQRDGLKRLYGRQIFLRIFASPSYLAARRAVIEQELGSHAQARDSFRIALERSESSEQIPLLVGLANSYHALGDHTAAEPIYRDVLRRGARIANVYYNLAEGLLRRSVKLDDAVELLEEGIKLGGGPSNSLRLILAEVHAARGDHRRAKAALRRVARDASLQERFDAVAGEVGYDPSSDRSGEPTDCADPNVEEKSEPPGRRGRQAGRD